MGKRGGNAEQRETGVCPETKSDWQVVGDPMPVLWGRGGHGHVVVGPVSYEGVGTLYRSCRSLMGHFRKYI